MTDLRYRISTRACERSGKRSGAGRKSGGAEQSVERAWQKTMELERSAEREVAERHRHSQGAQWVQVRPPGREKFFSCVILRVSCKRTPKRRKKSFDDIFAGRSRGLEGHQVFFRKKVHPPRKSWLRLCGTGSGVTEISWSAEWLFRRSHSAHML